MLAQLIANLGYAAHEDACAELMAEYGEPSQDREADGELVLT
jgi:hypothetical protein